jgi:hypothetical protein
MSSPRFDPNIIERYAEQLYRKADSVRVGSAITGAVLGVIFGAVPISPLGAYLPVPSTFGMATILLGALVGAFLGYAIGEGRAFRIRLQAQLVLFQLQLERNTSAAPAPPAAPVVPPAAPVVPAVAQVAAPVAVAPVAPLEPLIPVQPAQPAPVALAPLAAPAPASPSIPQAVEPPPLLAPRPPLQPMPPFQPAEELAAPLLPPLSPSRSS